MKRILLMLLMTSFLFSCGYMNSQKVECATVTDKERIHKKEGSGYYLVYTDKGEFKIEDQLFKGNFNSSGWYGSFSVDSMYTFSTGGYRLPFFSEYPTVSSKPINCNQ